MLMPSFPRLLPLLLCFILVLIFFGVSLIVQEEDALTIMLQHVEANRNFSSLPILSADGSIASVDSYKLNGQIVYANNTCTIDYIVNNVRLEQDDSCFIDVIRRHCLNNKPVSYVGHNNSTLFTLTRHYSETIENGPSDDAILLPLFKNKTEGFFIEYGTRYIPRFLINTLHMEKYWNWSGILIEPEEDAYQHLLTQKRNVWIIPTCLSQETCPSKVRYGQSGVVRCFPLYSILLAVGHHQTVVDYFSLVLDDGSELDILKTIPWDKVNIKILTVAWNTTRNAALPEYMKSVGYKTAQQMRFYFIDYLIFFK